MNLKMLKLNGKILVSYFIFVLQLGLVLGEWFKICKLNINVNQIYCFFFFYIFRQFFNELYIVISSRRYDNIIISNTKILA